MKVQILHHGWIVVFSLALSTLQAQDNVAINNTGSPPDSSAILDVQSTTKGMLIPRMTTVQRELINNPAVGLLVFDLDTESFWFKETASWVELREGNIKSLADDDNDTKVLVEETPDDDIIRFIAAGNEFGRIDGERFEMGNDTGSLYIGIGAGLNTVSVAKENTFVGKKAGSETSSGSRNTFIGNAAGMTNQVGSGNVAVGDSAISLAGNIGFVTAVGAYAGQYSDQPGNTFIGFQSGRYSDAFNSIFIGRNAGLRTTGQSNTFIGAHAGRDTLTGNYNTFLGAVSGYTNRSGHMNTFNGYGAGWDNTTGSFNTFLGAVSGRQNVTGQENTFIGFGSGELNTSGTRNTFLGTLSGRQLSTGSNNVLIGYNAGLENLSGSYNVAVGDSSLMLASSTGKRTALGHQAGMSGTNSLGTDIGFQAGKYADGGQSTHVGYQAGYRDMGIRSTIIGAFAGSDTLTGNNSTFIGYQAGQRNTSGGENLFAGAFAGWSNTTASDNTFVGVSAGVYTVQGGLNTFIGRAAGLFNKSGTRNTFIGYNAGYGSLMTFDTTNSRNTCIGAVAGAALTGGVRNVFVGDGTGGSNTLGNRNTFIGEDAGLDNTLGSDNTFVGQSAGYSNTTADFNIAIGSSALFQNTTGVENAVVGHFAGYQTSGSRNVFLGRFAGYHETGSDKLYIDNDSVTTPLIYGDFIQRFVTLHGPVGINTIEPDREVAVFDTDNDGDAIIKIFASNGAEREMLIGVNQSSGGLISMQTDNDLQFRTNGSTRMVVKKTGEVGIGTISPSEKLHVSGNICYTGLISACSDIRYKKDIIPLSSVFSKLAAIGTYTYAWDTQNFPDKGFTDERQLGVIAQEIEQHFPELVLTDATGYKSVDYAKMSVILLQGMKEQQQQIFDLNTALEEQQDWYKKRLEKIEQQLGISSDAANR